MKYIETFREGAHISEVYLCKTKQIALTKNGKEYGSLTLQDKTGTVDAKIWELNFSRGSMSLRLWIMCSWMQT